MSRDDRKQLLAAFLEEVWSQGRVEACDKYVGASYTIHHDPGDPWNGQTLDLAGLKARVAQSRMPFPDQRFTLVSMLEDDGKAAIAWTWAATHQGDIPGFPATRLPVTMSGLTIYDFDENDRIRGHWQIVDRLSVFQQLRQNAEAGQPLS